MTRENTMKVKSTEGRIQVLKMIVEYNESRNTWIDSLKTTIRDIEIMKELLKLNKDDEYAKSQLVKYEGYVANYRKWIKQDMENMKKFRNLL